MKLTESHLRRMIRKELRGKRNLNEISMQTIDEFIMLVTDAYGALKKADSLKWRGMDPRAKDLLKDALSSVEVLVEIVES